MASYAPGDVVTAPSEPRTATPSFTSSPALSNDSGTLSSTTAGFARVSPTGLTSKDVPGSTEPASEGKGEDSLRCTVIVALEASAPAGTTMEKSGGTLTTPPSEPMLRDATCPSSRSNGSV